MLMPFGVWQFFGERVVADDVSLVVGLYHMVVIGFGAYFYGGCSLSFHATCDSRCAVLVLWSWEYARLVAL